jgi:hypothetical protein
LNLRGEQQNSEVMDGAYSYSLHASLAPDRVYLGIDQCRYITINREGMRRPYYAFNEPHHLISTCRNPEKVLFLTGDSSCEYWLGRVLKQTWRGVRAAHFAPDGKSLTIVSSDQVRKYEEMA